MKQRLFIIFLAAIAAAGCSMSDTLKPNVTEPSGKAISFSDDSEILEATKGLIYTNSNLTQMDVYAYYTAENTWRAAAKNDVVSFMRHQLIEKNESGEWEYDPPKYWSKNENNKFSFFGFVPYGNLTEEVDADSGKPSFKYTLLPQADDNDDLLAAVEYDRNVTQGQVIFNYKHALTRISLWGKLSKKIDTETFKAAGEGNVRLVINGITYQNICQNGTMSFDDKGDFTWAVDPTSQIDYVATEGLTLLPYAPPTQTKSVLTTTSQDLSIDGKAIFILPQDVQDATLKVSIRKIFDRIDSKGDVIEKDCEMLYTTDALAIPTPENSGEFAQGDWINMTFAFDPADLDEYDTPMTVSSVVHPWNDIDLEVSIHKNIYMYTSNLDVEFSSDPTEGAKFTIYTNYYNDLRIPKRRIELDDAIITSRGLLFYSSAFTTDNTEVCYVPTLLNTNGEKLVYVTQANKDQYPTVNPSAGKVYKYDNHGFELAWVETEQTWHLQYYDPVSFKKRQLPTDLSAFEKDGVVRYIVNVAADTPKDKLDDRFKDYTFNFSVERTDRDKLGLYVSTAVGSDSSYGVNKKGEDPVYILTLNSDKSHAAIAGGTFKGTIGVEMISNGGGIMEMKYKVTATAATK